MLLREDEGDNSKSCVYIKVITTTKIIDFLHEKQFGPVLAYGSHRSKKHVRFARMCIRRLPPKSAIQYCINAANESVPSRAASGRTFEDEGFVTFRQLLPELKNRFLDFWPRSS